MSKDGQSSSKLDISIRGLTYKVEEIFKKVERKRKMENIREKLKDMRDQFRKPNIYLAIIPKRTGNMRERNYQRKDKNFQIGRSH